MAALRIVFFLAISVFVSTKQIVKSLEPNEEAGLAFTVRQLSRRFSILEQQNRNLREDNDVLRKDISDLRKENYVLGKDIGDLRTGFESLWNRFDKLNKHGKIKNQYASSAYGCVLDVITLSCDNTTTINVTSAYYGQYASGCSGCCPPEAEDCVESMVENRLGDWLELKYTCDGQTECEYQNLGSLVQTCDLPYEAHYLNIYYDCLSETPEVSDPVAFTAYLAGGGNYDDGDIIIFNSIVTNIGNHYDPVTGYFVCPVNGIYVFSISCAKWLDGSSSAIHIIQDNSIITTAYTGSADYDQGSTVGVIECNVGQRVWGEARFTNNDIDGSSNDRTTSFSGFLLASY